MRQKSKQSGSGLLWVTKLSKHMRVPVKTALEKNTQEKRGGTAQECISKHKITVSWHIKPGFNKTFHQSLLTSWPKIFVQTQISPTHMQLIFPLCSVSSMPVWRHLPWCRSKKGAVHCCNGVESSGEKHLPGLSHIPTRAFRFMAHFLLQLGLHF